MAKQGLSRANVDALRRFVEQNEARRLLQPFGEQHFLLRRLLLSNL
jgi:hypothetical protein